MAETCGECGLDLREHPGGVLCAIGDHERAAGCPATRDDVAGTGKWGQFSCPICGAGALAHTGRLPGYVGFDPMDRMPRSSQGPGSSK